MTDRLEITYLPTADLKPYVRNARTHSEAQIAQLAASIKAFGWTNPVLVDEGGGLIAGHGRVQAALALGIDQVPTVCLPGLSEAQKRALVIADNKLALNAGWDVAMLAQELQALDTGEMPLGLTGFGEDELERLLTWAPGFANGLTDPDEVPEVPVVPVSKAGDIWLLGKHRLLCGDATKADDVSRLMAGAKATMMFTDPPWNVAIGLDNNPRHRQRTGLKNDNLSDSDFVTFLDGFVKATKEHVMGDIYCVLGSSEWPTLDATLRHNGLHWSATIIWVKDLFVLGRSKYHRRYEPIWYGWSDGGKSSFNDDRSLDDVWEIARPRRSPEHPTMKPAELVVRALNNSSEPGQIVLEPFSGSGTNFIAAEQTGRRCFAIELEPKYVDVAVERWQNFTGKTATLESTGAPFQKVNHGKRPEAATVASEAG